MKLEAKRPVGQEERVSVASGSLSFRANESFNLIANLICSLDLRRNTLSYDLLPFLAVAIANECMKHHGLDIVGVANHGQPIRRTGADGYIVIRTNSQSRTRQAAQHPQDACRY